MSILIIVLGASLGSFIGLVVDRYPGTSIISPASHCYSCQTKLGCYDLIPIISQIISKSKCRYCYTRIPYRYMVVETLFALLAILCFWQTISISQCLLLGTSVTLSLYDLKSHSFPLVVWLFPFVLLSILSTWQPATLIFLLLALIAEYKPIKIGSGDFLYLALLSLLQSFEALLWVIQLASFLGILRFTFKKDRELPFIPYLSLAYVLVLIGHHACL